MKFRSVLIAAVAAAALAGGAQAAETVEVDAGGLRSMRVSYAELDLTKPEGARVLLKRLDRAARQVCGEADIRSASARQSKMCRDQAVARAVGFVNRPALTAELGSAFALASL